MLLQKYILKQGFNPDFLGLFINPFFFARKGLYTNIKKYSSEIKGIVLDVGCGRKPYRSLFNVESYIGMDIENEGHDHTNEDIDIFYDGVLFPFSENFFDSIISNQVFEHVFEPDIFLLEIKRVLKPKGKLLLTVPFAWDEHEQPNDFARYSSFGIKYQLEKNGFKIIKQSKSVNDIRVIFQLLNMYIFKKLKSKNKYINVIISVLFISWLNILGQIVSFLLPKNDDLYLDNIILAEKT